MVVDEAIRIFARVHVESHVRQLVQKGEPEVVYTVITDSQAITGMPSGIRRAAPSKMSPGQMADVLKANPVPGQYLPSLDRGRPQYAELGKPPQELRSNCAYPVLDGRRTLSGLGHTCQHHARRA